ncbi:MAG: hypothetical protein FJ279_04990 [Planctomycetes bacterium]|nr:hypothetical protein [Verrucomicrobiota bacterium]MBM4044450.1 hypothetical protein [Planctomycetota bacterium]
MKRNLTPLTALLLATSTFGVATADEPIEARAWAQSCKQAPPVYRKAVAELIAAMKAEKLWDKCGLLLFFAAHEATPQAFNLKGCPNGELRGGFEHIPGRALKGNGADASFDTHVRLEEIPGFTLKNHGLYAYSADDVPGAFSIVGASGRGPMMAIRPRNLQWLGLWTGTPTQLQVGPTPSGIGLGGYSRFSDTEGIWIKDKASGPLALTPAAWPHSTLRILRHGAMTAYYPGGVSFVWAGAALTADEGAKLSACFDDCLAALGALGAIRVPPAPAYSGPGAFTREQIADVKPAGIKVFALTTPPASDDTDSQSYYHFPLTYAVCRPWTARDSTSTKVKCLELIWSDRALGPRPGEISTVPFKKGNDTCGVITLSNGKGTGRTEFDSFALAIGAMLGRTAYSAGLKPFDDARCLWKGQAMGWCDWLAHWGYDVSAWRALAAKSPNVETDPLFTTDVNADTGGIIMHRAYVAAHADAIFAQPSFTGGTIFAKRNIVILGPARAGDDPKFAGFIMDLEHADGRSPELFAESMEMWAHIIHSIKTADGAPRFIAGTAGHELDSGTGKLAGWDASVGHRVYEALDFVCVNVGNPKGRDIEERVQAQLNILRGPNGDAPVELKKIMLQVHLGMGGDQLKVPDAIAVRDWLQAHPQIGGVFQAPVGANFKAPPTDIVNRLRGTIYGLIQP